MTVLATCAVLGFATTLVDEASAINRWFLDHFKKKLPTNLDPSHWTKTDLANNVTYHNYLNNVRMLDNATFWCFITGIWKDHRIEVKRYYEMTFGLLFIGLMFEKQAINWLTNRWGCTYNKL